MAKFLSIVIPHYTETERDMFPLLSSISGQVGIDFSQLEVVIVNDGGGAGPLNADFLSLFHPEIRQVDLPKNYGPGVARQAGLDAAQGEYVTFCDADDVLHSVGVVGAFSQEVKQDAPDILATTWLEELPNPDGTFRYPSHENDNTWMHGKLFRRAFLTENDIRFHPELRVHEDSYFLSIAAALTERRRSVPFISYVWKYRPDSITRRNGGEYTYASIPTFIKACTMADKEVEKRNPALMEYKILQFTLYNFFSFHRPDWLAPERKQFLDAAEAAFVEHIKPFWYYWQEAAPQTIAEVYNQERTRNFGGCVENETVDAWIARLGLDGG